MSGDFFGQLLSGTITGPDSLINAGGGPLPTLQGAPSQFHAQTHAQINDRSRLLEGGLQPYAYGPNPMLINTQTQNNIPNKKQVVISKLFLPSAQCDAGTAQDPILEHALSDGDVAFSLRMSSDMLSYASAYAVVPRGTSSRAVQVINLTTVNYILWGLQVGAQMSGGSRWKTFFDQLCRLELVEFNGVYSVETVFNFLRSYIMPFGVLHGSDTQGGLHEGNDDPFVSPSDYVGAFAVEGKLLHVMNLWRGHDICEDDDLVLRLTRMEPQSGCINFNLSSSSRAQRAERAPVPMGWWYLDPVPLKYRTMVEFPHIHIGQSQKMISAYSRNRFGMDMPPWNARACIVGIPVQMTFEPCFRPSDSMLMTLYAGEDQDMEILRDLSALEDAPQVVQQISAGMGHSYTGKRHVNNAALSAPHALVAPPLSHSHAPAVAAFAGLMDGTAPNKKQKKEAVKVLSSAQL